VRILFVGDAVCSSGFARCTHAACDELHAAGHEVHVLGINYYGDPHTYPYPIWPCFQPLDSGRDPFGSTRLPTMVRKLQPDVVVLLNDPWNVPAYMKALDADGEEFALTGKAGQADRNMPPVIGWLAVDAKNQRGDGLNDLAHVVVWTQFAADELQAGGYEGGCSVVHLGVDHTVYAPAEDKAECRRRTCPPDMPEDAFLVGVVGRNQPRKRLDLTLEYFADWVNRFDVDNAQLYLHVAPTGDKGVDIGSLVRYHGLKNKVIVATPHISAGVSNEHMAMAYNAFDVYLSTSQGEGWGLPALEAMACGVPCVVPDWSGLGDWVGDAAVKVSCTSTALSAPLNGLAYTVGGVPDRSGTMWALQNLYRSSDMRATYRERGLNLASQHSWSQAGKQFRQVVESVVTVDAVGGKTA